MKKLLLLFAFSFLSVFAKEPLEYGEVKISKLISIYDGDSFAVDINEYPAIIGKNISIKIANITIPDKNDKNTEQRIKAYRATNFTKNYLKNGKTVILKNIKRDESFRLIATVIVDGKDLGLELIKKNLALPYETKKKPKLVIVN